MTRRLTITLPDDVAERLDGEPNASAYIAEAIRFKVAVERLAAVLEQDGVVVTGEGRTRMRHRLDAARAAMARPTAVAAREATRGRLGIR